MTFAARHGGWSAAQEEAAGAVAARIERAGLGVVRLSFVDAHGVLRGKTLVAAEAVRVLREGVRATTTLLMKDLSGKTAFPVFSADGGVGVPGLRGAADMVMLPDPLMFRVLPWAPHAGWVLCDLFMVNGAPMPLSSRAVMQGMVEALAARGMRFVAGVEIEFHVVRAGPVGADGRAGAGGLLNPGYQYLTELRADELDPLMEVLRGALEGLGLPLRTMEVEFGPSQVELTFGPGEGLVSADQLILVRSAVKQVCARHGYAASFMSRPRLPGVVSSGWHLHQSVRDAAGPGGAGRNLFAAEGALLSGFGRGWMAGLLAHAGGSCAFTTPTINGYKRYRPFTNAPTRACWAADNRGAMVRVLGGGDAATRLENRAGEPGANPYLAMAAQIASGLDGVDRGLDPGPAAGAPYEEGVALPGTLTEALAAMRADACLGAAFGGFFIEYFGRLKQAEIDRFNAEVSEWEHSEYFDIL